MGLCNEELSNLRNVNNKEEVSTSVATLSFMKPKLDRTAILAKMEELTEVKGWKMSKDNLTMWYSVTSELEAKELAKRLNTLECCKATVRKVKDKYERLVWCEQLNIEKKFATQQSPEAHI